MAKKGQLMRNRTRLTAAEPLGEPENRLGAFAAFPHQRVPNKTKVAYRKQGDHESADY